MEVDKKRKELLETAIAVAEAVAVSRSVNEYRVCFTTVSREESRKLVDKLLEKLLHILGAYHEELKTKDIEYEYSGGKEVVSDSMFPYKIMRLKLDEDIISGILSDK